MTSGRPLRSGRLAASIALTALALGATGCGESDADRIAGELAEQVKNADGGDLTDISCEESSGSKHVWYCEGEYRNGRDVKTHMEDQSHLDDEGEVERWTVTDDL